MIFGIALDRKNPEYTIEDLKFWMPSLAAFLDTDAGRVAFDNLYFIANNKIFYSIWGSDWKYAMSLCIAHYLMLIAKNAMNGNVGDTLPSVAALDTYAGILSSMTVGSFSKSFDLAKTMIDSDDAKWWNLTSAGATLMALYKTKAAPSIFVVTPTPAFCFDGRMKDFYRRKNEDASVFISEMYDYLNRQEDDIDELYKTRAISGKKNDIR